LLRVINDSKKIYPIVISVVNLILSFALFKVYISILEIDDYGRFSFLNSILSFPQMFVFSPVLSGLLFYLSHSINKSSSVYYGYVMACIQMFSITLLLFLFVIIVFSANDREILVRIGASGILNKVEVLLGITNIVLIYISNLFDQIFLANKKNLTFSTIQLSSLFFKVIGIILTYGLFRRTDIVAINILLILISIFIIVIQIIAVSKLKIIKWAFITKSNFKKIRFVKKVTLYSLVFMVWGPFQFIFFFVDRYAIKSYGSLAELGNYAALFQIGFTPIYLFLSIVSQYLAPEIFSREGNIYKYTLEVVVKLTLVLFSLAALIYPLRDIILEILLSSNYSLPSSIFIILFFAGAFFSLGQIGSVSLQSNKFPILLLFPKASMALLAYLLCFILMKLQGVLGVAFAMLIASVYYYFFIIILNLKKSKKHESKFC